MKLCGLPLLVALASPATAQMTGHQGHQGMLAAESHPQILDGYGDGGFPITTASPDAQRFFNNGMQLAHAFEHDAAVAAMREAERLDPQCAMCVWGEAWAGGPTINFGKEGDELKQLAELAAKAQALAKVHGTPTERALTDALVARYIDGGGNKPGDRAFAQAMDEIANANPDSDEFATIAADASMMVDEGPNPDLKVVTKAPMARLETVLARHPDYTPAIHFYIHLAEIAGEPAKAEPYAEKLGRLAPQSQHLIHMPSHIFYWVGRYEDAARVNRQAADIGYAQASRKYPDDPYAAWDLTYHPHNVFFGLGGALMAGDRDIALALAGPLLAQDARVDKWGAFRQTAGGMGYLATAFYAQDPRAMLGVPAPKLPWLLGQWHYARGEAYARLGDAAGVKSERRALSVPGKGKDEDLSRQASLSLKIARLVLKGRAAMLAQKFKPAAKAFAKAASIEEGKAFTGLGDPPMFWYSPRRSEAEARLAAGDRAGARAAAQRALKVRPKDPVAVALLSKLDGAAPTH
jgi:tetratricopeptide (TPR) repeat protein